MLHFYLTACLGFLNVFENPPFCPTHVPQSHTTSTTTSSSLLSFAALFYLHTLLNHTNTAWTARSEPPDHSVTQYINSSASEECLFPKTLRLHNSSNNITKHITADGAGREVAPRGTASSSHSRLRDGPGKHLVASILYTHLIKFSQKSEAEGKKMKPGVGE